jgi:cytoskeletal protein CcmA (bactofilin family)
MANVTKSPAVAPTVEMPAYLTEDARFEGTWRGDELIVQGQIDGQVTVTGWVRIGRSGKVEGTVKARSVEVNGSFSGEIRAQLIVFGESAKADGTFVSERLLMKDGAVVDGSFEQAPPSAPPPAEAKAGNAAKPAGAGGTPAKPVPVGQPLAKAAGEVTTEGAAKTESATTAPEGGAAAAPPAPTVEDKKA